MPRTPKAIVALPEASLALLTRLRASRTKPLGAPALRKLLAQHGYAAHAAVLAFETAFGGLEVPWEEASKDWKKKKEPRWIFGAGACLRSKAHDAPRGGNSQAKLGLVPVVYSPHDYLCYLDADGRAWGHDTIEQEKAKRVAKSGADLVTELVSFIAADTLEPQGPEPRQRPAPVRAAPPKPLEEPKGYAAHVSTIVPWRPAAKHYADWLDSKFHRDVGGVGVKVEARVGGALDVFGPAYTAEITRLVEGACIELAVSGKALGKEKVRVELRFTPEGPKTGRLTAYFWKAGASKSAVDALRDALWESHGTKLFNAFRK
jgi:hypothetical protein